MKTVIEMAREAGFDMPQGESFYQAWPEEIERFAELVRADEAKRADALAATIAGLRDILTFEAESKAEFIARVRNVLGACPDQRVMHAVMAEREACAKVAAGYGPNRPIVSKTPSSQIIGRWEGEQAASAGIEAAIRARSNT